MRIVVDGRPLLTSEHTGIGVYTAAALEATAQAAPDVHFELVCTGRESTLHYVPKFLSPNISVTKVAFSNRLLGVGSRMNLLPFERFARHQPDCVWFPGVTPGWTTLPTAMTIHDLSPWITPQFYTVKDHLYHRLAHLRARARDAELLFTVSAATARDVQQLWGIPAERLLATPLGVDHALFRSREQPSDRNNRAAYDLNRPYFAALATREPRKNLESVLEAYVNFRARCVHGPALALVGGSGWKSGHLARMIARSPVANDIVTTGFVPRAHLGALLRGAHAMVFPSFYEGFGLPVAEALTCGTPVIASAIPAHFEVAGSAAPAVFFVDPFNVTDIVRGMTEITKSAASWKDVALEYGPQRAQEYSWHALGVRTATALRGLQP